MEKFRKFTEFAVVLAICVAGIHISFYLAGEGRYLMVLIPVTVVLVCVYFYSYVTSAMVWSLP